MADQHDQNALNENGVTREDGCTEPSQSGGGFFEIRVKGQLNNEWSDWLEGLEVRLLDNGEMILFGRIVDQAALMGVLNKLSRLNLALMSVNEVRRME